MTAKEQLFELYKKCYEQRAVLTQAPALSIEITAFTPEDYDMTTAREEANRLISYLLSVKNVDRLKVPDALEIIEKTYADQPFWKNLILDYLAFVVDEEAEKIIVQAEHARQEALAILNEIRQREAEQEALIKTYAEPLKANRFAVDGVRLITNYFNMTRKDPKEAWDVLITNPGYFSPIITTDKEGNTILTPEQAKAENKKIASFLKNLSV